MSVPCSSRRSACWPGAVLRSSTMPRLPRLTALNAALSWPVAPAIRRVESPSGGSTLITSAPISHSCIAQKGPAITCVTSRTRIPSSALGPLLMSTPEAQFSSVDHVAYFTLNRPAARNAITWAMYDALLDACERVDRDAALRVLIIRANGDAFAAGTDIQQFAQFTSAEDGIAYERR